MRCRLLLLMFAVSVCQSVRQSEQDRVWGELLGAKETLLDGSLDLPTARGIRCSHRQITLDSCYFCFQRFLLFQI